MYATIVFTTSQTIGCGGEPPPSDNGSLQELPPLDGGLPQCSQYIENPDTYGYCIYKFAGGFPSVTEVDRLCPMSGDWEKECRHAWVSGRMNPNNGFETEDLLKVCDENIDCTFELLDFRPEDDVLAQMALCSKYTGSYGRDCTGHAMQRWWHSKPTEEDSIRVAQTPNQFPDRVGYYLAVNVACGNVGSCDGERRIQEVCEKAADDFRRNPDRCPPQEKRPMHPNVRPQDLVPHSGQNKPLQQPVNRPPQAPNPQ